MKQLLIFDGISGSRKTTTLTAINHARNFKDYHFHRFTATEWVYANLYNRPFDLTEIHRIEKQIQEIFTVTYVWMSCPPKVALTRKLELKDPYIETQIDKAATLFKRYWDEVSLYNMKLALDSTQPLEDNVEILKKHLETLDSLYDRTGQRYFF